MNPNLSEKHLAAAGLTTLGLVEADDTISSQSLALIKSVFKHYDGEY